MAMRPPIHALLPLICIAFRLRLCSSFAPATSDERFLGRLRRRGQTSPTLSSSSGREDSDADCRADNAEQEFSFRRRAVAASLAVPATAACVLSLSPPFGSGAASAAETPAEAVRLLSSKTVPGLGPPDVYFPPYFAGRWRATRIVTSSDDDFWNGLKLNGVNLPLTIVSDMRFVPHDAGGDFSTADAAVGNPNGVPAVADRAFNERSYRESLSQEVSRLFSTAKPLLPAIRTLDWTPTNPNVLSVAYADGSTREVKVTKRSSDTNGDGVFCSEFRRITEVPPASGGGVVAGGVPSISKSRVLTKWRRAEGNAGGDTNLIEGLEILYNERGTLGERRADPLLGGGANGLSSIYGRDSKDLSDWRSTKTKILLERIIG